MKGGIDNMSVKVISILKAVLIAVMISFGIRVVAATSVTNEIDTARSQVERSKCNSYDSTGLPRDAELKSALAQLTVEYREQYGELKCVHDKFMMHVTILVTIVSLIIPLLSWLEKREFQKEFETTKSRLREAQESDRELKKSEARGCLATAKFTWTLLLHEMARGSVQGYRIAEPLYRICNALTQASLVKDKQIMRDCVNSVTKTIAAYNEVVKLHEGQHEAFKSFVIEHRFLVDSAVCDLSWFLQTKTKEKEILLRFFNDFGIKMFGEFV